jgi:tripartite-type tricarboxylate transporter receptor subunit TctC
VTTRRHHAINDITTRRREETTMIGRTHRRTSPRMPARSVRRAASTAVAAALLCAALPGARAADAPWPSKPIRLVVPFPAGGGSDNIARLVGKALTESLGQPVIVENKPGAAATIGAQHVARAAPDGYTLLIGNAAVITLTPQLRQAGFDPVKSFAPIATLSGSYAVVAVRKDLPAEDFKGFVELARRSPGSLTCGTSGAGGATHLGCAILADRLGIELRPVHYKGSAPAGNDLVAGVIDLIIDPVAMPHVKAGRVRAIAARGSGDGPHPELPGVPGLAQVGAPSGTETWFGVLAPVGTPAVIVERVASVIEKLTQAPDYAATLLPLSMYPLYMGPKEFSARIPRDVAVYGDIIRKTGIKADD